MKPDRSPRWGFFHRHALFFVLVSPLLANAIGSIFNVIYNQVQVQPLLTENQMTRFFSVVTWLNLVVYPIAIACFVIAVWRLRPVHHKLIAGELIDQAELDTARIRVVNLPWWFLTVASVGWLICIPVFPLALWNVGEVLRPQAVTHLVTSFLIASMIAVTQSFFAVELTIQRLLFPIFFDKTSPAGIAGSRALSITQRGLFWTFSAVVCPIVSLLLILLVPDAANQAPLFGILVGVVAMIFGFVTSLMLGRLVATPIRVLTKAAKRVAEGDLDTHVGVQRADEFGVLIDNFNSMVGGLREREHLQETFGRHVGQEAAQQILRGGDVGSGRSELISVMFLDVRNFTRQSANNPPESVVASLNVLYGHAVETIEHNGGMVNKFLGDGLMAIFGIGDSRSGSSSHADQAVQSAVELQQFVDGNRPRFTQLDWPDFAIGIGINSGNAIVGSIGSPKRQEYTAMGDTVNVAARVESLTKQLGHSILITADTHRQLTQRYDVTQLPTQSVKGKSAIDVLAVNTTPTQ